MSNISKSLTISYYKLESRVCTHRSALRLYARKTKLCSCILISVVFINCHCNNFIVPLNVFTTNSYCLLVSHIVCSFSPTSCSLQKEASSPVMNQTLRNSVQLGDGWQHDRQEWRRMSMATLKIWLVDGVLFRLAKVSVCRLSVWEWSPLMVQ